MVSDLFAVWPNDGNGFGTEFDVEAPVNVSSWNGVETVPDAYSGFGVNTDTEPGDWVERFFREHV